MRFWSPAWSRRTTWKDQNQAKMWRWITRTIYSVGQKALLRYKYLSLGMILSRDMQKFRKLPATWTVIKIFLIPNFKKLMRTIVLYRTLLQRWKTQSKMLLIQAAILNNKAVKRHEPNSSQNLYLRIRDRLKMWTFSHTYRLTQNKVIGNVLKAINKMSSIMTS